MYMLRLWLEILMPPYRTTYCTVMLSVFLRTRRRRGMTRAFHRAWGIRPPPPPPTRHSFSRAPTYHLFDCSEQQHPSSFDVPNLDGDIPMCAREQKLKTICNNTPESRNKPKTRIVICLSPLSHHLLRACLTPREVQVVVDGGLFALAAYFLATGVLAATHARSKRFADHR
ncbi:unnamed protein product [Ectocarpus sp. 8 AP-2014]